MRRAAKVDDNHGAVVQALRACGARVLSLAALGDGCPDLLVLHRGKLRLIEIKDGAKPPSKRKLTPDQIEFHRDWPVSIVETVDQALALVALREQATFGEGFQIQGSHGEVVGRMP